MSQVAVAAGVAAVGVAAAAAAASGVGGAVWQRHGRRTEAQRADTAPCPPWVEAVAGRRRTAAEAPS